MTRRAGFIVGAITAATTVLSCGTKFEKADAGDYGTDGGGNDCQAQTIDTLRNPVYMLIVLAGSGRMTGEKWDAATGSLRTFFTNLGANPDNRTAIGFTIFS